ncbi:hypothetical protein DH2020_020573 [Rehmannia glutinosa]|uniref:Leucine-rich repeat-containing N-terminal plant-type domain-containing protein n=1 Tax=Rehmannia glutinosa TaxID=99300 RepID=A0ABR0WKR8_REHGL
MASGLILFAFCSLFATVGRSQSGDMAVMQDLKRSLNSPSQLGWTDSDPCKWDHVQCRDGRVTRIQIGHQNLQGFLPPNLNNLTSLQVFEVQNNQLTGSLPSFSGLNSLQSLLLSSNNFTSIPPDFFNGMTSLQDVYLDYNPFNSWVIPDGLKSASTLQTFSATSANISGPLPDFFGAETFSSLTNLRLAFNNLEGPLPSTFAGSSIQSLWLNGQKGSSRLNGSIAVLQNMTQLSEVWLHSNSFSGPLPDFSGLIQLQNLSLRDNSLTGPVPDSLCCRDVGYPTTFAENWKGNDPCAASWKGITCNSGNITVVNFHGMGLSGIISPSFSQITSLQRLILSNNNLTGTIPNELTTLPNLVALDVSNNQIYGKVPSFRSNVLVNTDGNVNIGKDGPPPSAHGGNGNSPGSSSSDGNRSGNSNGRKSSTGVVVGSVVGGCLRTSLCWGVGFLRL